MLEKAPHIFKNTYDWERGAHYKDYAEGSFQAGGQGYVQPHAPRKIVQYPTDRYEGDSRDPRVVEKLIDYDADGNQTTIKKKTADPEDPVAEKTETLRHYRWDEEDRLRAVDLAPENDENRPEVATYTYDADGQRSIKYVPEGLEAHYSVKDAGRKQHLATMLYPSPLLTVEALDLPEDEDLPPDDRSLKDLNGYHLTRYTKHYFIGSERLNSTIGSQKNLGVLCEPIYGTISAEIVTEMNNKVENAGSALTEDYTAFGKEANLDKPYFYSDNEYLTFCGEPLPDRYAAFWFHPDHLGSSNYITDLNGNISQHLEYFPFGETLVEEHKNSNNSPFKFNAKELDDETGNYYYGARYYSSKYNLMLSVDPASEMYPSFSPYAYTLQNPVKYVDPTGMVVEDPPAYEITLDEVVVTANVSNKNKADYTQMPEWLRNTAFMNNHWSTPFDGTMDDYNSEFGTDYGDHNPGDVYAQWYYQTFYKPTYEKMISDIHSSQLKGGLTTLAIGFAPFAMQGIGLRATAKMAIDLSAQYAITGEVDYFDVVSSGIAPAAIAPALNATVDLKSSGVGTVFNGSKSLNNAGIDGFTGYLMFGLKTGASSNASSQLAIPTDILMNTLLKKQQK